MVDQTDLMRAQSLNSSLRDIAFAIDIFNADGRIVRLTVASPIDAFPASEITIRTDYIDYPQQMKDAIVAALHQREDAIMSELSGIGVTGVAPQPR